MMDALATLHCTIGLLVTPGYLCLTLVALLSVLVPFLGELASHGKTRSLPASSSSSSSSKSKSPAATATATPVANDNQHKNRNNKGSTPSSSSSNDNHDNKRIKSWFWMTSRWNYVLNGNAFLIHKRYFLHFYLAGLGSMAGFLLVNNIIGSHHDADNDVIYNSNSNSGCPRGQFSAFGLLVIHLMRRCYECIAVHRFSDSSRMHLAGYLCGMVHYLFLPYMLFDVVCHGTSSSSEKHPQSSSFHLLQWCAMSLCLWGQWEQFYHHSLLALLRPPPPPPSSSTPPLVPKNRSTSLHQSSSSASNDKALTSLADNMGHKIPSGGWFEYLSCPHYLAEIIIYLALIFVLWFGVRGMANNNNNDIFDMSMKCLNDKQHQNETEGTCPNVGPLILLFRRIPSNLLHVLILLREYRHLFLLLWVSCNLTVTACQSHQWYHKTYPSYATLNRTAIFPWVL